VVLKREQLEILRKAGEARRNLVLAHLVNPSAIVSHGIPADPAITRLQLVLMHPLGLVYWRLNSSSGSDYSSS